MTPTAEHRPTYATTDLDNLAYNFHSVREFLGPQNKVLAVVKANAYGHGAVGCSRRLESEGVDWLGVALPEEGIELREAGIRVPILVLGSFWPGQVDAILDHALTPVILTFEQASALNNAARRRDLTADCHLKIDTGMGRIGVRYDAVAELASKLSMLTNIRIDGVMTHFAAADDLEQRSFTKLQMQRFDQSVEILRSNGFAPTFVDLANSPAAIAYPESRRGMARIGGILYGLGGDVLPAGIPAPTLKPVLSLRSAIAHLKNVPKGETLGYGRTFMTVRDSVIATVPIGYADGYPRAVSNKGKVIIKGGFAPVVGRVSMDWTIVDVTDIPAGIGDEVTLIGREGSLSIAAEDIAQWAGTISYEITCGVSQRVERRT